MLVNMALRRLKQKDYLEFKVNLGNIVNIYLTNNNNSNFFLHSKQDQTRALYILHSVHHFIINFSFIVVILCQENLIYICKRMKLDSCWDSCAPSLDVLSVLMAIQTASPDEVPLFTSLYIFTYFLSFKTSLHILRYRNFLKTICVVIKYFLPKSTLKILIFHVCACMWVCVCAYIYVCMCASVCVLACVHACEHACTCRGQRVMSKVFLDHLYLIC